MTAKNPLEQGIKKTKIRIVGVGGAGGNAVSHMAKWNVRGVELIAVNCDIVDLKKIDADKKIQIGKNLTQGLGAGMKPEVGRKAAEEGREEISEALKDSDIVFVAAGMGGGTGTLSAGVVAEIAKAMGALTIGIVILPFVFEGQYRMRLAKQGLADLKQKVDAIIVIPNDKIINRNYKEQTVQEAFSLSDDILRQAVQGISDLIVVPGLINLDFADIKAIMQNSGPVLFGVGQGRGEKRVEEAVDMALNSPFLNASIKGATGLLFNISGGDDLSIEDVKETAKLVTQSISPQAKIVFGAIQDGKAYKDGTIKLTVIATGVEQND
ncbi:MAG: cell division protein FtsZ [Candidatus Paceibacterota bacterium]